jgi:hypothetical protein
MILSALALVVAAVCIIGAYNLLRDALGDLW